MSQRGMYRLYRFLGVWGLAALMATLMFNLGCGVVSRSSANQTQGDPLHLGASPGPLGSTNPQTIQVRLGSEPSDRIVSLSLTLSSLQATNSGNANIELLTPNPNPASVTVEFTRSAIVTEPISTGSIYQDTYSALVFPAMTGQVVFYDKTGQLVSQSLTVPTQTVAITPFVLGTTSPLVLSISVDLAQTFVITDPIGSSSFVTANPLVVTSGTAAPVPAVAPAVGQPETGNILFLVGSVTNVDTVAHIISIQPASGDPVQIYYDNAGGTQFVNVDPSTLTGMMIEVDAATKNNGTVLASEVALIDSQTRSELYGLLSGFAPEGIEYNLIVDGGSGVNVAPSLIGNNVTINWEGASYSVNSANVDLSASQDLVFDESRAFPGQFVEVEGDTLMVPDPDSTNAGVMQPAMFELNQQTISGTVSGYTFDPTLNIWTFTLNVASNAPIRIMNPGFVSITVRQTPQTYLRNNPVFTDGASVKVRGLLFADPNYTNVDYLPNPPNPVAFIMVASRVSK